MEKKSKMNSKTKLKIVEKNNNQVYNPLKKKIKENSRINLEMILSRYKKITPQIVLAILSKNKKLRLDIENRMVADYLSKKFNYFKKIKDISKIGYLKLISTLKYEKNKANEIIINIGDENNNFYILFEGSVIVYKEKKHIKNKLLIEIREYLRRLNQIDKQKYKYITKKNKNLELDFDKIIEDDYKLQASDKKYNFYYEELEEIGTFSDGFSFGETELIKRTNRELIIKTVTDSKLIYFNKFDYNRILQTTEEKDLEKKADIFIKNFPLFKKWTIEQLVKLFNYFIQETLYKDEFIYKQNDDDEYLYFFEEGTVVQYANVSFSWYKEYLEYVKTFNNNLLDVLLKLKYKNNKNEAIDDINTYLIEKIEEITKENNKENYRKKYPFLNINNIYMQRKTDLIKISQLYNEDKNIDNFFKIKFDENDINNPEKLYRLPIAFTNIPTIFGLEEIFELKNRLTTVGCLSDKVKIKKIKIIDLLNILYSNKEFDYIETFLELIIQKKLILCEAIKIKIKKYGTDFEKYMKERYKNIINHPNIIKYKENKSFIVDEKLQDKVIIALRLKGWNNGLYLDNILDTNLCLFKPKSKKIIKMEEDEKCKTLKALYKIKTFTNEKTLYNTKYSFEKYLKKNSKKFLKSINLDEIKHHKIRNMKSISIKSNKHIKNFFKTNIPLDEEKLLFEAIKNKSEKDKKKEKSVTFKEKKYFSPLNELTKNKRHIFRKMINYKVSEETKDENDKDKSNNENNNGYSNLNSGSIWTRSIDNLPSII